MRKQEKGNEKKVKKEKSGVRRLKPAAGLRSGDFLLMIFTAALVIFGVIMAVSYTHLDVYKRQQLYRYQREQTFLR